MPISPTFTPVDGQITSLPVLPLALTGTEVMEIVSPGNANAGNSYQATTATFAAFYAAYSALNRTVITSGATYNAVTTDTQIFVDKTVGSVTQILLPPSLTMAYASAILIKDWKGDAATNPITIVFSSSETCDGQTSVVINNAYGWVYLLPGPGATSQIGWGQVG
jgi:hypothetical protein